MTAAIIVCVLVVCQMGLLIYGVAVTLSIHRQHKQNAKTLRTIAHIKQLLPDPKAKEWGDQKALLERCLQAVYDPEDRRN